VIPLLASAGVDNVIGLVIAVVLLGLLFLVLVFPERF
jgi:K+-transporting ATPase KdpF subunit